MVSSRLSASVHHTIAGAERYGNPGHVALVPARAAFFATIAEVETSVSHPHRIDSFIAQEYSRSPRRYGRDAVTEASRDGILCHCA